MMERSLRPPTRTTPIDRAHDVYIVVSPLGHHAFDFLDTARITIGATTGIVYGSGVEFDGVDEAMVECINLMDSPSVSITLKHKKRVRVLVKYHIVVQVVISPRLECRKGPPMARKFFLNLRDTLSHPHEEKECDQQGQD